MRESPAFLKMKAEGKVSKAPLRESFTQWGNLKVVLTALFSINAGQAVTFYTAQFYVLFFLTQVLKVDGGTANGLLIVALVLGAPFFIVAGWLSDRIGRKPVLLAGLLLATLFYFPLFKGLTHYANPAIDQASRRSPISVVADPATCTFQFDPVGKATFDSPATRSRPSGQGRPALLDGGGARRQRRQGADRRDRDRRLRRRSDGGRGEDGRLSAAGRRQPGEQADGDRHHLRPGTDLHPLLRPAGGADGRTVPRPASAIPRCPCRTTSATAGSAASCPRSRSPWWCTPATSSTASGIRC
ncbi:MFS transporter [Pseudomonas aeruginosa]|nr:MFS transporter [Pseudomonas aeruginosa]